MATVLPFDIYSVVRGGMFDSDFYFVNIQVPVILILDLLAFLYGISYVVLQSMYILH